MPRLLLGGGNFVALPAGDPADAQVWRDARGTVCARSYRAGRQHVFDVHDLGRFYFDPDAGDVRVVSEPGVSAAALQATFRRLVRPLVLQVRGSELLHASAVHFPQGVVAFCADSETGKSTVACGLGRRGFPVWADDAVVWAPGPDRLEVLALPFVLGIRPATAAFFADEAAPLAPPAALRGPTSRRQHAPLAAVCVLARSAPPAGPPLLARRLAPAAGFRAVFTYGQVFDLADPQHKRRVVTHYLDLAARIPIWEVRFADDFAALPAVLEGLATLLGGGPAR